MPPPPPTGSYDPSLDAAEAAAHRGYGDLQQDVGLAGSRAGQDYGIGIADLDQAKTRGLQDYTTNTSLLQRSFQQLAASQQEQANAAGVLRGGAALQSAAKRAENQGIQQTALNTGWSRQQQDIKSQVDRLGLDFQRGVADRTTALTRAGREDRRFGVDTSTQKSWQAAQAGYVPPGRGEPGGIARNEYKDAKGAYRVQTIGGRKAKVRPDGSVQWLEKRPMARRSRGRAGAGARRI